MRYSGAITDSDVIDGLSVRFLKVFGVWQANNDYIITGKRNSFIKYQVIITLIYYAPYIFFQCLSFFVIKVDIQKGTFISFNALVAVQICIKTFLFWLRMETVSKLYRLMRKDFLRVVPRSKGEEVKEIFLKITKRCNMVCMAVSCAFASTTLMIVAYPQMSIDYIAHHTGDMAAVTGGKKKILGGWYPVSMAESPYYEAIYLYEFIGMVLGGTLVTLYACMYYQMLVCLHSQFMVLGYHISTLKINCINIEKRRRDNDDVRSDSAMYKELYAILREHQTLLSYANELRSLFNPLVTMILGIGIYILSTAIFQFNAARELSMVISSIQYLAAEAIEICMFCSGSSAIEAASSDLQFAIYSSDWYKADVKFRKTAQMVMVRARKGETLTAIKMYPVNMETIMAIFQFTYSVSALMSRTTEQKKS